MKGLIRFAWLGLAAVHLLPALGLGSAAVRQRLYGPMPEGDVALLLAHRGVIFAALLIISIIAAFKPQVRLAAAIALSISVIGFLVLYAVHGQPSGPLQQVALVDLCALPLLAIVWLERLRR